MTNPNLLQDLPLKIDGIATKVLTNTILAKFPHLEIAVMHPDHLSQGEKGMIQDPNPQQITIEGNAKFLLPWFQRNREMVQFPRQDVKGMSLQDLLVTEIEMTKNKNGGKGIKVTAAIVTMKGIKSTNNRIRTLKNMEKKMYEIITGIATVIITGNKNSLKYLHKVH